MQENYGCICSSHWPDIFRPNINHDSDDWSKNNNKYYLSKAHNLHLWSAAIQTLSWHQVDLSRDFSKFHPKIRWNTSTHVMNFACCIGTLMTNSGLEEILNKTCSGVKNMVSGKNLSMNLRALIMVATGHHDYARSGSYYLRNMETFLCVGEVLEEFIKREFSMSYITLPQRYWKILTIEKKSMTKVSRIS